MCIRDSLRKATNTFRDTLTNRSLDLARRSAATAGMLSELSRGRDLVRLLDLMLAPRLVGEPENLAEWRSIVRFVRSATITTEGGNVPATVTQDPVSQAA